METPTERIDRWIKEEGQGNTRDALNVALCRLDNLKGMIVNLKIDKLNLAEEVRRLKTIIYETGLWDNDANVPDTDADAVPDTDPYPFPTNSHHVECECNLCTYGREALPANEY